MKRYKRIFGVALLLAVCLLIVGVAKCRDMAKHGRRRAFYFGPLGVSIGFGAPEKLFQVVDYDEWLKHHPNRHAPHEPH